MKKFFIPLFLLIFLASPLEAAHKVLVLQSVQIAPYEAAVRGFEQVTAGELERLFISEMKEKEVLKRINASRPDMLLAVGRDGLATAGRLSGLPVVYCMVLNPRTLIGSRKNISGVSMNLPPDIQLGELLRVLPDLGNIGLLYDPGHTGRFVRELGAAASRLGVTLTAAEVRNSRDVPRLLRSMKGKVQAFWMLPDITVVAPETVESIFLFSLENKAPVITFSEKYLDLGAMISIGIDPFDIGRQAGELGQKISRGENPAPAQHLSARKALISVNVKIAGKLGIKLDEKIMRDLRIMR